MPTDSGTNDILSLGFLHYTTAVSREMSDEPEVVRHLPIVEEPVPFELRASERPPDGFFGDGDNHLPYALVGQLVQRNKHQSAAFARSGRSLHEQILSVALFVNHALHFAHTHGIDIG